MESTNPNGALVNTSHSQDIDRGIMAGKGGFGFRISGKG